MRLIFILTAFLLCSNIALAVGRCEASAEAVIGVLEFDVKKCQIEGKLEQHSGYLAGTFTVDLAKLDTGVSLRNEHMKNKYLETKRYPKAKLVLKPLRIGSSKFEAALTLHGKTKRIKGRVLESSATKLRAEFQVDITDYGISKPGYKGIVVGQNINVVATVW